ncbi:hypothetical protein BGZ60DRAFT_533885 [Tricladium varicosporioides]|nr:hypothetical protein BGZ60DRAFT_533885 [Hymenoscyphus varicosporioides]
MPQPAEIIDGKKTFVVLENNPQVMTPLAASLGLSPNTLTFHDILSLTDPTLLSPPFLPRPVVALLVIIPLTPAWNADRLAEDADIAEYAGTGEDEDGIVWFKQTIGHACGSIGLLHCLINGAARRHILPNSTLAKIREKAIPLGMKERAKMLYDDEAFEEAHQSVAEMGDTDAPNASTADKLGQHFVAFVKGDDGRLWELEGSRKGPICRGQLGEGEDVMSEAAVKMGLGRIMELEKRWVEKELGMSLDEESRGGDLRFSAVAICGGRGEE